MMKIKRKLISLLLMVAVVIALLPAVGARNVKAAIWSKPDVSEENSSITLYVRPYAGNAIVDSSYAYNATLTIYTKGTRTIKLTEKWYDSGSEMTNFDTFVAGKQYTYQATVVSENSSAGSSFPLSRDKFKVVDPQTKVPFEWDEKVEIKEDSLNCRTLTYEADFVAQKFIADKGSYNLDLSEDRITFESTNPDRFILESSFEGMIDFDNNIDIVSQNHDDSEGVDKCELDLDQDGSADIRLAEYPAKSVYEKLPTSSIKDQITIKMSDACKTAIDSYEEYYYSSVTFIFKRAIADCTVTAIPDQTCTGSEINPAPTVKYNSDTLKAGTDYDLSYKNNTNVGTATITITGKGRYTGTKDITFKIVEPAAETIKTKTGTYSVQNNEATFTAPAQKSAKNVTVPATIKAGGKTVKVTTIAPNALKSMKKLTKVTIGKNVTTIGKNAFANDAKLTTVTIGKNVKTIGAKAFYKCKALKKITIKTKKLTKKTIGAKAFTGINKKAVIKSPKAKKAAYKKILLKKGMKKTMTFK